MWGVGVVCSFMWDVINVCQRWCLVFSEDTDGDLDRVRECCCRGSCMHTVSHVGSLKPRMMFAQQKFKVGTSNVGFWSRNCSMALRDSSRVTRPLGMWYNGSGLSLRTFVICGSSGSSSTPLHIMSTSFSRMWSSTSRTWSSSSVRLQLVVGGHSCWGVLTCAHGVV